MGQSPWQSRSQSNGKFNCLLFIRVNDCSLVSLLSFQPKITHSLAHSIFPCIICLQLDRAFGRNSRRGQSVASYASFYDDEDLYATIDESNRLWRLYETQFDLILPNNNFETTFEELREAVDSLSTEPQWVPISWINSEWWGSFSIHHETSLQAKHICPTRTTFLLYSYSINLSIISID